MPWEIEDRGHALVVHMNSHSTNRMNARFFSDCHAALDRLDAELPGRPIVLTGDGATFSAGLDFTDVFPRFRSGDLAAIGAFFDEFRAMMLRVFLAPRRTVAAVNGHAFAGGFILALACDARVLVRGPVRFSLKEVPIGIAIPSTYLELVRHALGDPATGEAALSGTVYDVDGALALGFARKAVDPSQLLAEAITLAEVTPLDAATAYAATKKALRAPVVERLEQLSRALDTEAFHAVTAPDSLRLQQAAFDRLRKPKE